MNDVKWKSDKHCIECKKEYRKEIIAEVQEACKGCKKMFKVEQEKKNKNTIKKHKR